MLHAFHRAGRHLCHLKLFASMPTTVTVRVLDLIGLYVAGGTSGMANWWSAGENASRPEGRDGLRRWPFRNDSSFSTIGRNGQRSSSAVFVD